MIRVPSAPLLDLEGCHQRHRARVHVREAVVAGLHRGTGVEPAAVVGDLQAHRVAVGRESTPGVSRRGVARDVAQALASDGEQLGDDLHRQGR